MKMGEIFKKIGQIDDVSQSLKNLDLFSNPEEKNAAIDALIQSGSVYSIRQILGNSKIVLSSEQMNLLRIVSPEEYDSYQRYRETSFVSNLDRKTSFFSNFVYPMLSSLIDWTVNIFVLNYNESFLQDRYRMLINASNHSEIARSLDPYLSEFIDYIKFGSRFTSLDVLRKATDTVFPPSEENDLKFLQMVFFNDHPNELDVLKRESIFRLRGDLNRLSETWRSNLLASATIGEIIWTGWQGGSCSYLFLEGALLPLKVYLQRGYKFEAMLQSGLFLVRNSPIIWQCGQEIVAGVVESTRDPSLHKTDL